MTVLREAEESLRLFYAMLENFLTVKEVEKKVRQAAEGR